MNKKQIEELGKGFINLANLLGGLSVINGVFGKNAIDALSFVLIGYAFILLYFAGIITLGTIKGEDNE